MRIRVKAETEDKKNAGGPSTNLLGKMTNLVTSDLGHVNEARNMLLLLIVVPVQITGAIVFLYQVLGWR